MDFEQPAPPIPNTAGTGHWEPGEPFNNVIYHTGASYWSSTTYNGLLAYIWKTFAIHGVASGLEKFETSYVWPVRGGQ